MMNTRILYNNREDLKIAAEIIRKGGVVAIPTETVYGLVADAFNEEAVEKIYIAKKREAKKPLLVLIPNIREISKLTDNFNSTAKKLAQHFWAGPLTIIFDKAENIPSIVTANGDTIAIRLTSSKLAREIMNISKKVLVAPSANISGEKPLITGEEVKSKFFGIIDAILYDSEIKNENNSEVSTLVSISNSGKVNILREGLISRDAIYNCIQKKYPLVVGITGNSGSGKSAICKELCDNKGYMIIDADKISREVVQKGKPCLHDIAKNFGNDILNKDQTLNRKKLANIVFYSNDKLDKLNNITHPYIINRIKEIIDEANSDNIKVIILDAPTLFQSGAEVLCNNIISIVCSNEERINRIINRDRITQKEAEARVNVGLEDELYKQNSDFIVKSDKSIEKLCKIIKEKIELWAN